MQSDEVRTNTELMIEYADDRVGVLQGLSMGSSEVKYVQNVQGTDQ